MAVQFFKNRLLLAACGMILFGLIGAAIAAGSVRQNTTQTTFASAPTATTAPENPSPVTGPTTTATPIPTSSAKNPAPTPTETPLSPTAKPGTTPTMPPPGGAPVDLHGSIAAIDVAKNTFTLNLTTSTTTVLCMGTQFVGDVGSLAAERVNFRVEVKGAYRADGILVATLVNTDSGQ